MIDFPFSMPSVLLTMYVWLFFLLLFFINKSKYLGQCTYQKGTSKLFLSFLFLFVVTHCIDGDFFHYLERVHILNVNPYTEFGQETFHTKLAVILNGNYLLYRVVVWGGALLMMAYTAKRLGLQYGSTLFLFFSLYVFFFSYARVSLAMSTYFLGVSYIVKPSTNKRIVSYLFAAALVAVSYQFHHSILIAIVLTPIVFLPINRFTLIGMIILFPILIRYFGDIFQLVLSDETIIDNEYLYDKLSRYSERKSDKGIVRLVIDFFTLACFFVPVLYETYYLKFKRVNCERFVTWFYNLAVGLLFISVCFSMIDMDSDKIGERVRIMSFIPITIVLESLKEKGVITYKRLNRMVYLGCFAQSLRYLYSAYLTGL